MRECSDRVRELIEGINNKSSKELFEIIEGELNTRITVGISSKKVFGEEVYGNRIKIDGVLFCSEYNVLKANVEYLTIATKIIKEKIRLEKMIKLYKGVIHSAINGLTKNEFIGVRAVLEKIESTATLINVSQVSMEAKVTRSIIINGLKKLECAGIVEICSKGAKGTEVKLLYDEVKTVVLNR